MNYDELRIYELPIKEIFADEVFNSRGFINPTDVIELARDIAVNGLDQPITVRPFNDPTKPEKHFQVVAGFRRYKAHLVNKAETIKCIVREKLDDAEARIHNLRENLQRSNLNMKQEAHAIEKLSFLSSDKIANKLSVSKGWVQNRLALLQLPDDIQDEVVAGLLTVHEIRTCAKLPTLDDMYEYVRKIKDKKLMGKVREINAEKIIQKSEKKIRSATEMGEIQDLVRECYGNGIATRCLAWAAGVIDDNELYDSMRDDMRRIGKESRLLLIPDNKKIVKEEEPREEEQVESVSGY